MASALHRVCNEAGLAASTEVQCIPGSTNVPADLYIYSSASDTKPTAVDVGVISPQYNSWSAEQGYTMHRMEEVKLRKYADDLKSAPHLRFVPFVVSTYGSLGTKARSFVSYLASCLCKRVVWSLLDAQHYVRRVVQASVMAFMGAQMLTTLNMVSRA